MAHLCVCVLLSLPLYLGWASDALAAASGTHFKLAHATDATTTTSHFESDDARYPCTLTKSLKYSNDP